MVKRVARRWYRIKRRQDATTYGYERESDEIKKKRKGEDVSSPSKVKQ